jgi:hypothetical protein
MDSNSNLGKSMTHHNQTKELTTWFLSVCAVQAWSRIFLKESFPERAWSESVSAWSFYSSRAGSYIETWGPTGDPEVVETLYTI